MALDFAPATVSIMTLFFILCSTEHNKKNWLFSDTPKGAEASAIVYTMIEMVRAHELNIYKYLNYLLENLPSTKTRDTALAKLAPWNQNVIAACSGTM